MELSQQLLDAATRAGACGEAIRSLRAGQPIDEIPSEHLAWAAEAGVATPAIVENAVVILASEHNVEIELLAPIDAAHVGVAGDGDGDGAGYGYGDGYGYGAGYGDGYGYGDGDGDGGSRL